MIETIDDNAIGEMLISMMDGDMLSKMMREEVKEEPAVAAVAAAVDVFAMIEQKRKDTKLDVRITPLFVSTQSAKARMSVPLALRKVAEAVKTHCEYQILAGNNSSPIVGVEYGDIKIGITKRRIQKKNGKGKAFPNNCTVLVRSSMGTGRTINMKLFQNGSISMTGCKIEEDGMAVTKILEKFLVKKAEIFANTEEQQTFRILDFEITNVNSNYGIGFDVERQRLYDVFNKNYPELDVTYDPSSYSGVKIRFFYNAIKEKQNGMCECQKMGNVKTVCKGRTTASTGNKLGQCKVITVAVFQTGNIINTGGRNMKQTLVAYEFVNKILLRHAEEYIHISLANL